MDQTTLQDPKENTSLRGRMMTDPINSEAQSIDELSVIVCTHNPRPDYLRRTLAGLRAQTLAVTRWELLLIDNASDQPLANQWDLSWHASGRHVLESKMGLTPARLRGIRESRGNVLVFVDDDNVLAPDFLEEALELMAQYSYLGVLGAGVVEPEFEIQPPPDLVARKQMLAVRTITDTTWSNNPRDYSCMPFGAGMCIRRRVARAYEGLLSGLGVSDVVDRQGQRLFSGGDDLFSWASSAIGLGFGLSPNLRVKHLIQAKRLERAYFVRLFRDHAFSHGVLRYLLTGTEPRRVDLFQSARIAFHWLRNGRFSAQCQWAALSGENGAARFVTKRLLEPLPSLRNLMEGERSRGAAAEQALALTSARP